MSEGTAQRLSGVAKTLLVTLYIRAMESQRPDALIKDERAEALVRQLDQGTLRKTLALTDDFSRVAVILKGREFDRIAQDFLARHPDAAVVHIGCGLDTRFERVCSERLDNGQVEWYDLDLPEVIEFRRKLIGGEGARHHFLACSVLESAWLDTVSAHQQIPLLFLAEGVFMYFEEAQVKSLVLTLREHFPGAELVFDALSPIHVWRHNLQMRTCKVAIHVRWGSGTDRSSKAGAQASACSTNGDSLTTRRHAWTQSAGCAPLKPWPGRFAFTTSSLERQECEETFDLQANRRATCLRLLIRT